MWYAGLHMNAMNPHTQYQVSSIIVCLFFASPYKFCLVVAYVHINECEN